MDTWPVNQSLVRPQMGNRIDSLAGYKILGARTFLFSAERPAPGFPRSCVANGNPSVHLCLTSQSIPFLLLFILPASRSPLHFMGPWLSQTYSESGGAAIQGCVFGCLNFLVSVALFLLL